MIFTKLFIFQNIEVFMREVTVFLHTQKIQPRPALLRPACAAIGTAIKRATRRLFSRLPSHKCGPLDCS